MPIEFGDDREPWSVARNKAKRFVHALVRDVKALRPSQQAELRSWLAGLGVASDVASLLVTRSEDGYRVHVTGAAFDVQFVDLPVWLQTQSAQGERGEDGKRSRRRT